MNRFGKIRVVVGGGRQRVGTRWQGQSVLGSAVYFIIFVSKIEQGRGDFRVDKGESVGTRQLEPNRRCAIVIDQCLNREFVVVLANQSSVIDGFSCESVALCIPESKSVDSALLIARKVGSIDNG